MKITKTQLRQIIKEELNQLQQLPNDPHDLARYVLDNWEAIVGVPFDPTEEGHFPDEIEALVDRSGVDFMEFNDAFTEAAEGYYEEEDEDKTYRNNYDAEKFAE